MSQQKNKSLGDYMNINTTDYKAVTTYIYKWLRKDMGMSARTALDVCRRRIVLSCGKWTYQIGRPKN